MKAARRFYAVCAVFTATLGCVSNQGSGEAASSSEKQPLWVTKPSAAFPENKYLAASGEGHERSSAEAAAKGALAAMFSQSVSSAVTSVERGTNIDGKLSATSEVVLENQSRISMEALSGVEIPELWYGKKEHRWYAVAIIEKVSGRRTYSGLLDAALAEAGRLLTGEVTFDALSRCAKAREAADRAVSYALVLSRLGGPDRRAEAAALIRRADEEAMAARESLPVDVRVSGDKSGRIKAAFAAAVNGAGLITGDVGARYALQVIYGVESAAPGRYFNSRYTLSAVLQDTKTGAELLTYSVTERTAHPAGQAEADARALLDAERHIKEYFSQKLISLTR